MISNKTRWTHSTPRCLRTKGPRGLARGPWFLSSSTLWIICLVWTSGQGTVVSAGENWPQWRGPSGNGTTSETGLTTTWSATDGEQIAWKRPLSQPGNSTPIVWNDAVFLTQPSGSERSLIRLSRQDGSLVWQQSVPVGNTTEQSHETNPYCSSSPVTDGERVIVWYGSAGVHCYSFEGRLLWSRDLGSQEHMWGYGTSPILVGDMCILSFGPGSHEFLVALDKRTGATRWRLEAWTDEQELAMSGPENNGNAEMPAPDKSRGEILRGAWSTPVVVRRGDGQELIVTLPRRVLGIDPQTGQELWRCGGYAPLVYASPMLANDTVVALGGYFGASLAVRTGGSGDVTATHRLWHKPRDGTWLGTGVTRDGHAYVCDMAGVASCLEIATGETRWKKRLEGSGGKGSTWSSATLTDDGHIYLLNQVADTFVLRANPEKYDEVARNSLEKGEATNASVVIAQGDILLRTDQALWCIRGKRGER